MMKKSIVLIIAFALEAVSQQPSADQIFASTGISGGLCVHYGCGTGSLTAQLQNRGKMVVHGVAFDSTSLRQARKAAIIAGVYGVVTIEYLEKATRLPYPSNFVNLFVCDADQIGTDAPADLEIDRVLVPDGVSYVKRGGSWKSVVKRWPDGMDGWTHWCYGPGNNAVSRDRIAGPSTNFKWQLGLRGNDLRFSNGLVFAPVDTGAELRNPKKFRYDGRDAFNGIPRWSRPFPYGNESLRSEFAATANRVFCFPSGNPCKAVALDASTGAVIKEYTSGVTRPDSLGTKSTVRGKAYLVVAGNRLIQAYRRKLLALDVNSGEALWSYASAANIGQLAVTPDGDTCFISETNSTDDGGSRWDHYANNIAVTMVVKGAEKWRNTQLREECYQLTYRNGVLVYINGESNMAPMDDTSRAYRINISDGSIAWRALADSSNPGTTINNLIIRDDGVFGFGTGIRRWDLSSGKVSYALRWGYNVRCPRMTATDDWLFFGIQFFANRNWSVLHNHAGRSGCAWPVFPAYGQIHYGYNGVCWCINPIRGMFAFSSDILPDTVTDSKRLELGAYFNDQVKEMPADAPEIAKSLLVSDWHCDSLVALVRTRNTSLVTWNDLTLTADIHRHRLAATRNGSEIWSFRTGGRIYREPTIWKDYCYVASADGHIYCLRASDGVPQWRFLAAPSQRRVMAYGQIESAWPVYGATVHNDTLFFSSGRSCELDNGIFIYGIDPVSGKKLFKTCLRLNHDFMPGPDIRTSKNGVIGSPGRTPLNGYMESEGGVLSLRALKAIYSQGNSSCCKPVLMPTDEWNKILFPVDGAWNGQIINPMNLSTVNIRYIGGPQVTGKTAGAIRLEKGYFYTPEETHVSIAMYDLQGRLAARLYDGKARPGWTVFSYYPARNFSGKYLIRMSVRENAIVKVLHIGNPKIR